MTTPSYRARIQHLADTLISVIPETWAEAEIRGTFVSPIRTRFEIYHRSAAGGQNAGVRVSAVAADEVVDALRAMRDELTAAGNPECKGLTFKLSREGKSSLDVEY